MQSEERPVGGAANVYGILYQILASLNWAASASFSARRSADHGYLSQALLVLEPIGGGGDLQIHGASGMLVEQYKTRSGGRTWSVGDIVSDVLLDLYLAVPMDLTAPCSYRFVTDARLGRTSAAQHFFRELAERDLPAEPLRALDANERLRFLHGQLLSRREFFRYIAAQLRENRRAIRQEPEALTLRKLWHLLSNFEIHAEIHRDMFDKQIDVFLGDIVNYKEEKQKIKLALCGMLLDWSSIGGKRFTPAELLRAVDIHDVTSLSDRVALQQGSRECLKRALRDATYEPQLDVRPGVSTPAPSRPLLICGESGCGKTWRLARLASSAAKDDEWLVVWVPAAGKVSEDLAAAAKTLWHQILRREVPFTFQPLIEKLKAAHPRLQGRILLCVDNVLTAREARELIRENWAEMGVSLAMTVPEPVATAMSGEYSERVETTKIDRFRGGELNEYLKRRGRDWSQIPSDVHETLKNPLLASIYCEIDDDPGWAPRSEYELYERYWLRVTTAKEQPNHPGDVRVLVKLASLLLHSDSPYPWTATQLETVGLTDEVQTRLENVGWLQRVPGNRAKVWHDRLLNWAVAEAALERESQSREKSVTRLLDRTRTAAPSRSVSLAYVPVDVLWLKAKRTGWSPSELSSAIAALERAVYAQIPEVLYAQLLPTLGRRVIPALIQRVREVAGSDRARYSKFLASALKTIGRDDSGISDVIAGLLDDPTPELQSAAVSVLAVHPDSSRLDRLWNLQKRSSKALRDTDSVGRFEDYRRTMDALRACVRSDLMWLQKKILDSTAANAPLGELAYILASLPRSPGLEIWTRVKSHLMDQLEGKPRPLITCIRAFRDLSEVDRLTTWLSIEEDWAGRSSLWALAAMAPNAALKALAHRPEMDFLILKNWWLPMLYLDDPAAVNDLIRGRLQRCAPETFWTVAGAFEGHENKMELTTLRLILDQLEGDLVRYSRNPPPSNQRPLSRPLQIVARVTTKDLLLELETRKGSPLETKLADFACTWVGRGRQFVDHELEDARRVLLKLSGDGYARLMLSYLTHKDERYRVEGLRWCLASERAELVDTLIARFTNAGTPPDSQSSAERMYVILTLAALGLDGLVTKTVMTCGAKIVSTQLTTVRRGHPPMSDEDLAPATLALEADDQDRRINAIHALSISGRADFLNLVPDLLLIEDPSSEREHAVTWLVEELGPIDPQALGEIAAKVPLERRPDFARLVFRLSKSDAALHALHSFLQDKLGRNDLNEDDSMTAITLSQHDTTRTAGARWAWSFLRTQPRPKWLQGLILAASELDDEEVQEFLFDEAVSDEDSQHLDWHLLEAIEGLRRTEPEYAFQAAARGLRRRRLGRERLTQLLVELDATRATEFLLHQILGEEQTTWDVWWVGRALRQLPETVLIKPLSTSLDGSSSVIREQVAEVVGWIGPTCLTETIDEMARDDSDLRVAEAAHRSIQRRRSELEILNLFRTFSTLDRRAQWTYLDAILELGDPYLLEMSTDRLALTTLLKDAPGAMETHARWRLKSNQRNVRKAAEAVDRARQSL